MRLIISIGTSGGGRNPSPPRFPHLRGLDRGRRRALPRSRARHQRSRDRLKLRACILSRRPHAAMALFPVGASLRDRPEPPTGTRKWQWQRPARRSLPVLALVLADQDNPPCVVSPAGIFAAADRADVHLLGARDV